LTTPAQEKQFHDVANDADWWHAGANVLRRNG
jgi:hypothetical protein